MSRAAWRYRLMDLHVKLLPRAAVFWNYSADGTPSTPPKVGRVSRMSGVENVEDDE